MKKRIIGILLLFFLYGLFAQDQSVLSQKSVLTDQNVLTDEDILSKEKITTQLQLALTTKDYPATPGDIYTLTFTYAKGSATMDLLVEADYTVNMRIFGSINVSGMTFQSAKRAIEQRVAEAYPESSPFVILTTLGVFRVYIKGEVKSAGFYNASGFSRLNQAIAAFKTAYSSTREVAVIDSQGNERSYDLFQALRYGAIDQNPYLKLGDTIVLKKYERKVGIRGQVKRPGVYQILADESLKEVVLDYADGLTVLADRSRLSVARISNRGETKTFYLTAKDDDLDSFTLMDNDQIQVSSIMDKLPVIYFEGAVSASEEERNRVPGASERLKYTLIPDEKLSSVVSKLKNIFVPNADLAHSFIVRGNTVISVDIERLLSQYDAQEDKELLSGDRIIIPFTQQFVTVSGAVTNPGIFSYVPNKTADYYIGLAGGRDLEKNSGRGVQITSKENRSRKADAVIQTEDTVYVPYDSINYVMEKVTPIVTVVATTGALILSILNYLR